MSAATARTAAMLLVSMLVCLALLPHTITHTLALGDAPCTDEGGSDVCRCSGTRVNCDFVTSYTRVPFGLPVGVTHFSLYSGAIRSLSFSAFTSPQPLLDLEVIDVTDNVITFVSQAAFFAQGQLRELRLANNGIRSLDVDTFETLTNLRVLDLSDNEIQRLDEDIFVRLTTLEELYLQGNSLTSLPNAIFQTLTNLKILRLDRNRLDVIRNGVFDALVSATDISITVNSIHTIQPGVFDEATALRSLVMLGNPSSCRLAAGNIVCLCNLGYGGAPDEQDDEFSYCLPKDCGTEITTLHPNATADCSASTTFGGRPCTATCHEGYGGLSSQFICNANGVWEGTLECEPVDCGDVVDGIVNGGGTCSGDTRFDGDQCLVGCNEGHSIFGTRDDFVPFTCNAQGNWEGSIICLPISCGSSITGLENTRSVSCNPNTFGSTCTVSCATGYEGADADFVCGAEGEWEGSITCIGRDCGRIVPDSLLPEQMTARCRGDSSYGGDNCIATCDSGFTGPDYTFRCGITGEWRGLGRAPECVRASCPSSVPNIARLNRVANCTDTLFEDTCESQCFPGFRGDPTTFTCGGDQQWEGDFSSACEPIDCGAEILDYGGKGVTGTCTGNTLLGGDSCTAVCRPGYEGTGSEFTCDADGRWRGESECTRIECGRPQILDPNARISCFDTVALGDGCIAACALGTKEGTDFRCNANGEWEGFVRCVVREGDTPAPFASSGDGGITSGSIIGIIIGVVALILLIIVVIIVLKFKAARPPPELYAEYAAYAAHVQQQRRADKKNGIYASGPGSGFYGGNGVGKMNKSKKGKKGNKLAAMLDTVESKEKGMIMNQMNPAYTGPNKQNTMENPLEYYAAVARTQGGPQRSQAPQAQYAVNPNDVYDVIDTPAPPQLSRPSVRNLPKPIDVTGL